MCVCVVVGSPVLAVNLSSLIQIFIIINIYLKKYTTNFLNTSIIYLLRGQKCLLVLLFLSFRSYKMTKHYKHSWKVFSIKSMLYLVRTPTSWMANLDFYCTRCLPFTIKCKKLRNSGNIICIELVTQCLNALFYG